jgi:hypothetical protein
MSIIVRAKELMNGMKIKQCPTGRKLHWSTPRDPESLLIINIDLKPIPIE